MLSRKNQIEDLKRKKKIKDLISFFSIEGCCSLDSFLDSESAYSLMKTSFDLALSNEIDKFNFSTEMKNKEGKGRSISNEDKARLSKAFVEKVNVKELIVFVWKKEVFGLVVKQDKFNIIEQLIRKIDGDILLVSNDALNGISFLNEEHFIRFSEWLNVSHGSVVNLPKNDVTP